ncbi:MAG TPA: polyprenyl synthetase family protein [Candidatus Saccharimonadales bacterium]|nr:polyprenyl synthetase family protein [Candidatus Saccharimonadales bacterium]
MKDLQNFKQEFDAILKDYFETKISAFSKDPFLQNILNHAKNITLNGGKRIRPYVAYLTYESLGGKDREKTLQTLIGIELFHAFALVHDDIIDNADTRHNVKTLHTVFGNSQAILVGDLLFAWSQEVFADSKANKYYFKMANDTVLGQMIDVKLAAEEKATRQQLEQKILLKTARYTFVYPMQIGAVLANADEKILSFCKTFGEKLGFAFQMQDDVFDFKADIKEHQHTLITQYMQEHNASEPDALLYAKNTADKAFDDARNLLNDFAGKEKFLELIDFIQKRKS